LAEDAGQERTEQATQKRREETRARGQVARSLEVNSAVMLLAGFGVLMMFRHHFLENMMRLSRDVFSKSHAYRLTAPNVEAMFIVLTRDFLFILMPVLIAMLTAGIVVNILQVGFLFTGQPLQPKLSKINPVEGFQRLFSRRSVETFVRDIIKIIVVIWIAYFATKGFLNDIVRIADATPGQIMSFTGMSIFNISMKILMGYCVIALLDYAFQRWDYERSMMMTRQEVREELKQTEGDPLLRARIRSVQREIARRRMMEEIPKATVVVTNPTEIAVALMYETGMNAPVVVAKGRRLIAERIRERAVAAGVPIIQNILLAQALYKAVDIGRPIPSDLYTAVAEVLAYVWRLKGKKIV